MKDKRPWYERYKVDWPAGEHGDARIEKYSISKDEAAMFVVQSTSSGYPSRLRAGDYTRLILRGKLQMADTFDELLDHFDFIDRAAGNILVNGLGLGVAVRAILMKPKDARVRMVTAVEIDPDVIALVGGHLIRRFGQDRLRLVQADALEYTPPRGERFDCVWHDIWPDATMDNWDEMKRLHRKYGQRCDFQDSWKRGWVKRQLRQDREYERVYL